MADSPDSLGQLPVGPDRADGYGQNLGTATGAGQLVYNDSFGGTTIEIQERPDSPQFELAEQETCVHTWSMAYDEAMTRKEYYGRGTVLEDSNGDFWRVLSCSIKTVSGYAKPVLFSVSSESLSSNLPPDQFEFNPVELGINIIKYPRYFYAFNPLQSQDADYLNSQILNQQVIRVLQNYFENTPSQYRDALTLQLSVSIGYPGTVDGSGVAIPDDNIQIDLATGQESDSPTIPGWVTPICGTDLAKAAAIEIIQKYWRNEETPYIVGWEINWYTYYYLPQDLNPGGYIEDPVAEANPQLPNDCWDTSSTQSDTGSSDSQPSTIFDSFVSYNPQCYSQDGTPDGPLVISWLRKADHVDQTQRTWIKIRRQWVGTPIGFWDADLYNTNDRPSKTNDYNKITPPIMASKDVSTANCPGVNIGTVPS